MQDETALYGAKMMQPGMTAADSEENNLRPQHLEDYIGQEKVKQNLKIYLEAAKRRGEPVNNFFHQINGYVHIAAHLFGTNDVSFYRNSNFNLLSVFFHTQGYMNLCLRSKIPFQLAQLFLYG